MKQDRIFDGLSQHFRHTIYGSEDPRGKIRLYILQDDLLKYVQPDSSQWILDAGGGLGQMSMWLAELGYQVVLAEPSPEMLTEARLAIESVGMSERIRLQAATIQELAVKTSHSFQGIVMHAVLEWLAEPRTTLQQLLHLLQPGGWLSLMFFNQYSKEMRHLLAGDFAALQQKPVRSNVQNHLKPISPLPPEEVLSWLPELGLELVSWSGVRCFYDYAYPNIRKNMELNTLLQMERAYSQREPWRSLARYQHFFCRKLL
ncbi:MAG: SAM-dependent methyltransferase [Proteobacteria bacterium]|nr:MAG: SAM-dependent methyltransferase [Pseudomonadota bacterium]